MDDTNDNAGTISAEGQGAESTPNVDSLRAEIAALTEDRNKWKGLSRTNEKRWNDASSELENIRQSQMTDAEKALEAARVEARNATLAEVGTRLADAELRAQAARAGVELPQADFLNLSKFTGDDGSVNAELIGQFVSSLSQPAPEPNFAQDLGLGRQGGISQITRDDLSRMSTQEINAARKAGKLDSLMRGDI
ncbi:hypothetical protein [Streptomyces noursei]|uniref:hypothetical protein n=1 Tax=Streptomyces noursei TaxID=1971 RepID=UPI00167589FC|nr:hypothetical protein [Streptomyces noursei]MCZ1015605.1 hypothetical protein [Streptomyces noursei]GGW89420.1 hypothetical protein GCM10010341_07780 [Streptomyces noursei]